MAPMKSDRQKKPYARPRGSDGHWVHDRAPLQTTKAKAQAITASNAKLIVSNLHYEITPKDLVSIFGQIGTLVREPLIRYDRSGRSSGVAIVSFETSSEAAHAKTQFDGKIAKGQPMEIAFDTTPPPRVRSTSMPGLSTSSLLSRIERPSLAERLSGGDEPKRQGGSGPIRTRTPRSARAAPSLKTKAPKPTRSKAPTAEQLDRELDVFMGDDKGDATNGGSKLDSAAEDVEMA
ncbi:RNA-binding domain-containing protein [Rhizopogon vinicolor AM-OR11-026]|uniref:RNA-binding domain-containing protein n=1 Tax=Rhizopogon vinicolor AM-OR11-026 TaxID=1314800 RepID=A0A1B7N9X1_9AGAM|nr:RNA-binding domain-containing protein [Rhizopogon vinicolor AM-OR11-026]